MSNSSNKNPVAVEVTTCPHCGEPLLPDEVADNLCFTCHNPINEDKPSPILEGQNADVLHKNE